MTTPMTTLSPSLLYPVNMTFSNLFKKASNLLGLSSPGHLKPAPLDGEIIYCKNNVCVHPPAALSNEVEHFPGYLNIRSQDDEVRMHMLLVFPYYLENLEFCTLLFHDQEKAWNMFKSLNTWNFEGKTWNFQNVMVQIYF